MSAIGEEKEETGRRKGLIFLLLLLILMFGIVMGIGLIWGQKHDKGKGQTGVSAGQVNSGVELVIDKDAKKAPHYENNDISEQGVVIIGRETLTISADTKEAAVDFVNPEENAQLYYLTFELRLYNDNGQDYEVLYTSGLVEPGKRISSVTLSRELEKGVYNAVVHVQPYRMNEERTPTNNADMKMKLIVR